MNSSSDKLQPRQIITGSEDGTSQLWGFSDKDADDSYTCLGELGGKEGHIAGITSAAFSPGPVDKFGYMAFTASKDTRLKVWKLQPEISVHKELPTDNKQHHGHTRLGHTDYVNGACWMKAKGPPTILSWSDDCTAALWDPITGERTSLLGHDTDKHFCPVAMGQFTHDGSRVATCSYDSTIRIWVKDAGAKCAQKITNKLGKDSSSKTAAVWSIYFSNDDRELLAASKENNAKLWDVTTGSLVHVLDGKEKAHTDLVLHATFNSSCDQVLTCSMDNTAKLWDKRSGKLIDTLKDHRGAVWSARFAHDGKSIVTASHDMTSMVYDMRTLPILKNILSGHTGILWQANFSPDDQFVVTCSEDATARLWDISSGARKPPCYVLRNREYRHRSAVVCANFLESPIKEEHS